METQTSGGKGERGRFSVPWGVMIVLEGGGQVDSDGGPQEPGLKGFWRGRMGLSMEEQKQFYECGCLPRDEGSEEEEDEEEEGDDREHKKR